MVYSTDLHRAIDAKIAQLKESTPSDERFEELVQLFKEKYGEDEYDTRKMGFLL